MIWVLAIIGAATIVVLLWRAFGPGSRPLPQVTAPDDDPEFLRTLRTDEIDPPDEHRRSR